MRVTYRQDGALKTLDPALLVIACDPNALTEAIHYTSVEAAIFKRLESFTFYTTTLRVRPVRPQAWVVVLDPTLCGEAVGAVHGYRNETGKQWGLAAVNAQQTNLVTLYQIVKAGGRNDEAYLATLRKTFLDTPPDWWPFDTRSYEIVQVRETQPGGTTRIAANPLRTPYFNHFSGPNLATGLPWKWLNLQGRNGTIYVHASTCFESVLHCWSYIQLLMQSPQVLHSLPANPTAPIVVVGAGVSGLLFAQALRKRGYRSITLIEQTDRYAGKSHSLQVPDALGTTICELGTCYMSPAYDDMVEALAPFTGGNDRRQVCPSVQRGLLLRGTLLPFSEYGMQLACEWLGVPDDGPGRDVASAALLLAAGRYTEIRSEIIGSLDGIMPPQQPGRDSYGIFSRSFADFLKTYEMGVLIGYLNYAYEVQGYGSLDTIPAYYGLVWIMPDMAEFWGPAAGVTCWSAGWEDVWEQMVSQLGLDVRLNAQVLKIDRTEQASV